MGFLMQILYIFSFKQTKQSDFPHFYYVHLLDLLFYCTSHG